MIKKKNTLKILSKGASKLSMNHIYLNKVFTTLKKSSAYFLDRFIKLGYFIIKSGIMCDVGLEVFW